MPFTKYASLESGEVIEIKSSPGRVREASFNKFADFDGYREDDGYLYARIRAISSRVNKNHDGWPTIELAGGKEAWDKISSQRTAADGFTVTADTNQEYGFPTFIGKPNFVDHHNSDPKRARGVIVDSKFSVLDHKTAASDDYWSKKDIDPEHLPASEIELLVEIDAQSFPKFAKAVKDGDIDGWSMGCDVDYSKCSHCGNKASSPDEYCSHVISKGAEHTASDGTSKKSYENCYGIKFFEISGVFDPADETALSREVRSSVQKEGEKLFNIPEPHEVLQHARHLMISNPGMSLEEATEAAKHELMNRTTLNTGDIGNDGVITSDETVNPVKRDQWMRTPNKMPIPPQPINDAYTSSVKVAQPEEPQIDHLRAPEDVDTHRQEKVCPLCGSDIEGPKCDVCGYEEPPEQLQNPDLTQKQEIDLTEGEDQAVTIPNENPPGPPEGNAETMATQTRNPQPTSSVSSRMRWEPRIASAPKPQGDEPTETVTSDQTTPVTAAMRTARQMIAAAKTKETTMAGQRQAAEPVPAAKADKRVDVEGVGGVIQDTNAEASKPEGAHSWEDAGKTVDVTGKGGIIEDSNAEASKPSAGTESVEATSDNAGFQQGGQKGPNTKTFDNSNEPSSAVTDKAVRSHATEAAKQGVKPLKQDGVFDVNADARVNVEDDEYFDNRGTPTDQWTGTDGNGVTRQQNPVTQKPTQSGGIKASGLVSLAALKLADAEVALGLLPESEKYNRLAELAEVDDAEIAAEHRALAKVRTAGLTRTAAQGGVSRLPSFARIAHEPEQKVASVDDDALDAGLYR